MNAKAPPTPLVKLVAPEVELAAWSILVGGEGALRRQLPNGVVMHSEVWGRTSRVHPLIRLGVNVGGGSRQQTIG